MANGRPITDEPRQAPTDLVDWSRTNTFRVAMMSEPQGSLIYLMQFLEGHLSASESAATRARLDTPDWQAAWERLQLAAAETTLPASTGDEPDVPAETLAAFLEGALSLKEAARVEHHCWNSPELLREFVSTYRFLHVDAPHEAALASQPSGVAIDRLRALFPDPAVNAAPTGRNNGHSPRPSIEATRRATRSDASWVPTTDASDAELNDLAVVVTPRKRSSRSRRQRKSAWIVYAATIVIGLGLGIGAVVMIVRSRDSATRSHDQIVSPSEGRDPRTPRENPRAPVLDPRLPDEVPKRPEPTPPADPPRRLPTRPFDMVEDGAAPPDNSDPTPRQPRRPSPATIVKRPPDQTYRSLAVQWDKIDGLLVARDDDKRPWHGPYADVYQNATSYYATLPGSWASAQTNHGRLVLAEDTLVHVDGTRDSIDLNITRGRVAISQIPSDEKVNLRVGTKSWIIQPIEADTAFGCIVFARRSQLVVRRGRVTIGGTEIVAGRQVFLGDDSLDKPTAIVASTNWFTRPDKTLKAPAAVRDALLASRNVRADLETILRTEDHPARLFAARWSLAIGDDKTLVRALSAHDNKIRLLALDWLLSCEPNDPRVHLALRTLARQTGDAQMVRNVLSWLRSARMKSRVTRADADRLVAGLRSDHLAIRQISVFFLENAFGKRVAFDPVAGPVIRQRAAREWTAFLNRSDRATRLK